MNPLRRTLLKVTAAALMTTAATMLKVAHAVAASWNKAGFEAKVAPDALKALGAATATPSKEIVIAAPDIAEDGAQVLVTIISKLPNTQSISIVVDKNPFPLSSTFEFANGADGYVSTKIKMGQTSNITAVVRADGRFFAARKEVKVTIGGCGA